MKLRFKYGLQMLLRNPVRMIASFLTAIAALGIAGMCVFTYNYNTVSWEHELYFRYSDDKYTNITYGDNPQGNFLLTNLDTTREEMELLEADIREIGGEYAIQITQGQTISSSSGGGPNRISQSFGVDSLPDMFAVEYGKVDGEFPDSQAFCEYKGEMLFAPYLGSWQGGRLEMERGADMDTYQDFFEQTTVYSSEAALEEFGYELVGKLPEKKEEVAIPQWLYNCFLCYGYKSADGTEYVIEREDDIIGKTLPMIGWEAVEVWVDGTYVKTMYEQSNFDATIVGVVHTDLEAEGFFEKNLYYRSDCGQEQCLAGLNSDYSRPPHVGVIISRDYLMNHRVNNWYSTDSRSFIDCITVLRNGEHAEEYFDYVTAWRGDRDYLRTWQAETISVRQPSYAMPRPVSIFYSKISFIFFETSVYFDIIPYLGVFAAVLLMYLCFSTVMGKRRGVGIMQSMGASKWQMTVTIGVPLLLFCLLCSVGAVFVELGFLSYMNGRLMHDASLALTEAGYEILSLPNPFMIGWQTWLFTFGVPLLIAAVTTLVTVWLVFRTPVVDNLNKKDFRLFRKKVKTNPFTDHPWSGA